MIIIVEFSPTWSNYFHSWPALGSPFDVTLDYDSWTDGSWECLPGRLSFSKGYFETNGSDELVLQDILVVGNTYWNTAKYLWFGGRKPGGLAREAGVLRDFGTGPTAANGRTGKGDVRFHSSGIYSGTWRIKSGAPNTLLTAIPTP